MWYIMKLMKFSALWFINSSEIACLASVTWWSRYHIFMIKKLCLYCRARSPSLRLILWLWIERIVMVYSPSFLPVPPSRENYSQPTELFFFLVDMSSFLPTNDCTSKLHHHETYKCSFILFSFFFFFFLCHPSFIVVHPSVTWLWTQQRCKVWTRVIQSQMHNKNWVLQFVSRCRILY